MVLIPYITMCTTMVLMPMSIRVHGACPGRGRGDGHTMVGIVRIIGAGMALPTGDGVAHLIIIAGTMAGVTIGTMTGTTLLRVLP